MLPFPKSLPGLQVPIGLVITGPRVRRLLRCHQGVVLQILLRVADQTDTDITRDGRRNMTTISSLPFRPNFFFFFTFQQLWTFSYSVDRAEHSGMRSVSGKGIATIDKCLPLFRTHIRKCAYSDPSLLCGFSFISSGSGPHSPP